MKLLVSVVDAAEARLAVAGGVDVVDVKNPAEGSLGAPAPGGDRGRCAPCVPPELPLSAALGDLPAPARHGRARRARRGALRRGLREGRALGRRRPRTRPSRVLRAAREAVDGGAAVDRRRLRRRRARAEPAAAARGSSSPRRGAAGVARLPARHRGQGRPRAVRVARRPTRSRRSSPTAHDAGLEVALAGALRAEDLPAVRATGADIAGVRSAACRDGRRTAPLDPERIARLRALCAAEAPRAADGAGYASRASRPCGPRRAARRAAPARGRRSPTSRHRPRAAPRAGGRRRRRGAARRARRRSAARSARRPAASRVEARDRLDEHEPPGARGAGHPRGDRVRRDRPRRGQRVALGEQRGRAAGPARPGRAPARGRCAAPAPGMRSASAQPNWSIARIAIRCAVSRAAGRSGGRSARTASANSPPPGTTSSGWRAPASPIAAHSARSAPSPAVAREPAADLDDGQHGARRPAAASRRARRRAPRRARRRSTASRPPARPRRSAAARARNAPAPERHDRRRASRPRAATCRAAASIWRDLLGVEVGGDRVDLGRARAARRRRRRAARRARGAHGDGRRPPVGRRARVGLGREVARGSGARRR